MAPLTDAGVELVAPRRLHAHPVRRLRRRWLGRQLNIHPSLLPLFKGLHPQRQALDAGVRISRLHGAFRHAEDMDAGPIIAQAAVPVRRATRAARLAERILAAEHRLYPHALRSWPPARPARGRPRGRRGRH